MRTLHLVGYHDCFPLRINKLLNYECWAPTILVEEPIDSTIDLLKKYSDLTNVSDYELVDYIIEFKKELEKTGLSEPATMNIARLLWVRPELMIPCATKTKSKPEVYGSQRDIEIMSLVKKALEITEGDVTFFGGTKHAKYMANELELEHKILYDLRVEQSEYNLGLRIKLGL